MDENKIREPIQKRSIEKKEKIIRIGFNLMCKNGYHNTNCAEIAKSAGVSTGIVYNYFKDKKDIFIEGVKEFSNSIMYPMIDILTLPRIDKSNLETIVRKSINEFIKCHKMSKTAHEEMIAMSHLDPDIFEISNNSEIQVTDMIVTLLKNSDFNTENLKEKVHLLIGLVENLCHEIVYHKHPSMDYNSMLNETVKIIINTLK